jgi:hypothetical protein
VGYLLLVLSVVGLLYLVQYYALYLNLTAPVLSAHRHWHYSAVAVQQLNVNARGCTQLLCALRRGAKVPTQSNVRRAAALLSTCTVRLWLTSAIKYLEVAMAGWPTA